MILHLHLLLTPLLLLWWSALLLLLLDLGVTWIALDGANLVCMVMQLFFPQLVLLPSNECHSLNIDENGKGVFLLLLFLALQRGEHLPDGHTYSCLRSE